MHVNFIAIAITYSGILYFGCYVKGESFVRTDDKTMTLVPTSLIPLSVTEITLQGTAITYLEHLQFSAYHHLDILSMKNNEISAIADTAFQHTGKKLKLF